MTTVELPSAAVATARGCLEPRAAGSHTTGGRIWCSSSWMTSMSGCGWRWLCEGWRARGGRGRRRRKRKRKPDARWGWRGWRCVRGLAAAGSVQTRRMAARTPHGHRPVVPLRTGVALRTRRGRESPDWAALVPSPMITARQGTVAGARWHSRPTLPRARSPTSRRRRFGLHANPLSDCSRKANRHRRRSSPPSRLQTSHHQPCMAGVIGALSGLQTCQTR
mmetsp:Transcript_17253/g.54573  ORF Transcript_17253/g.54573 Transcript_17253/m.54573 type:complete len:221 (-) Transcript_17253:914-1576(-)